MILNYAWAVWLAWLLAAFLVLLGLSGLAGWASARDALLPQRASSRWHWAVGICCIAIGLMVAWYPTRIFGLLFGLLLCLAIGTALIRYRDFGRLPAPLALASVIAVTAWGLRLI